MLMRPTYVEERFDAKWARYGNQGTIDQSKKHDKDPNIKSSYYSRIYKQYVNLIRPVIQATTKSLKKPMNKVAFCTRKIQVQLHFSTTNAF